MIKIPNDSYQFLMRFNGKAIAAACIKYKLDEKLATLFSLAVSKDVRNMKFGSIFLEKIEKYLIDKGIEIIQLHANPKAINFYNRLGYVSGECLDDETLSDDHIDLIKYL
jgi:ribosomal protein S18 acetylase RimI-like enzyme